MLVQRGGERLFDHGEAESRSELCVSNPGGGTSELAFSGDGAHHLCWGATKVLRTYSLFYCSPEPLASLRLIGSRKV